MTVIYADSIEGVGTIRSGLFLDKLTGVNGIPRGVITEIFGDEGIGKSSICLQLIAEAQRQGLKCLWADVEWSYDPRYASILGVDNSKVGLIREQLAETTLDALEEEITSGKWDLIILDSIGAIHPRDDAEKDASGKTIASQAKLISKFCRKAIAPLSIHKTALVVINHSFVDLMSGKLMTSGGKKLAYHKAVSIRLKSKFGGTALKQGDRRIGKMVVGEVRKNKVGGTEGLEIEAQLLFGRGFSQSADLLNDAIDAGVITKRGNTYYFHEEKLAIGLHKARQKMEEDSGLGDRIKIELTPKNNGNPEQSDSSSEPIPAAI